MDQHVYRLMKKPSKSNKEQQKLRTKGDGKRFVTFVLLNAFKNTQKDIGCGKEVGQIKDLNKYTSDQIEKKHI